jgi:hypothetical protein
MHNEFDDIDLIIKQKLSNSSLDVPKDEWKSLDKELSYRNFFRFSFRHINIYYLTLLAILLFTSGDQLVENHRLKTEIKKLEKIIKNKSIQKPVTNFPSYYQKNNISIALKKGNQHVQNKKSQIINQKAIIKKPDELVKDSTSKTSEPDIQVTKSVNSYKQTSIKIVKKTIYKKTSPVIIRDTVIKYKKNN